ncbi:MAG TPA: acetate--CoA ligase family protein [Burkholderiales bacterium]|nr:acetate--CoA ligase family protein [Burkholderiales bacterium]
MTLAEDLLAPKVVALVGASADAAKNTGRPQRYLKKHGYAGRVIPINPARQEVQGERAWPSLAEAPGGIRHAFVMAPGDAVERALEDCGARGIPVMSVFSDGFADAGPGGMARQQRLAARAAALGVRVLGPNSMGVVNLSDRVPLTVNAVLEMDVLPVGGTSMVSQSGTMLGTVLSRGAARGLGFAKMVSLGNECDLGAGDVVDLLAEDAATQVILLFLETVRDAGRLAAAARKAHAAGKPVVAFKLGRSSLGEALARSHTGALAGTDAAMDAFFRDCGILRVDMLETLIEIAPLVAGRKPAALGRAPRMAVVTTTGGGAASVVDRLGTFGIEPVAPDAELRAKMEAIGVKLTDSPIVDLTMAGSSKQYAQVLDALLDSPACDGVLATVGSSAMFHPEHAVRPIMEAPRAAKPLGAFLTPQADRSLALLAEKGIAGFRTPEACADAFRAYFDWRAPRAIPALAVPVWPPGLPRAGTLDERQSLALFKELGIPVVESVAAVAPDFPHGLPYPVAAKILSPDIAHKTEAGGVALGIHGDAEFRARVAQLLEQVRSRRPGARIEGVLVQRMQRGLAEAIVGYRDDPLVGPTILLGAGGTLAELYKDFVLRLAPVSAEEAAEMIGRVTGLAIVRGYRGLPRGDLRALAQAVSALSRLALLPGRSVAEAEINPLIVDADGVVAVDGLAVLKT